MCIFNKDILFACVGEWVHGRPVSYFISAADEKKKSTPSFLLLLNVIL